MAHIGTMIANPASPKQVDFLIKLRTELFDITREIMIIKGEDAETIFAFDETRENMLTIGEISKHDASGQIDSLRRETLPTMRATLRSLRPAPAPLAPGIYRKGDTIVKVQKSRGSDRTYGKILTADGFEYAPGAANGLTADDRMTREEAVAYGRETGVCCVCGAELTDPTSVAAGIGPVCGKRF